MPIISIGVTGSIGYRQSQVPPVIVVLWRHYFAIMIRMISVLLVIIAIIIACSNAFSFRGGGASDCPSTRRDIISSTLSTAMATSASLLKPHKVFALEEDDTSPFTVQFTIQLDPASNPNEISQVEIEVYPDWAPLATSRFKELCTSGFYNNCPFFRVLPGFIAQFGISSNTDLNKQWLYCEEGSTNCKQPLPDEKRLVPNKKGTLSFASSGKNTRRTQVFINTVDNSGIPNFLDQQGFVPFAQVTKGMETIEKLNSEYGGKVSQGKAAYYGGEYFNKVFPRLSIIKEVNLI